MTEPDARLRVALLQLAEDAPAQGPSAAELLAMHRRRTKRVRARTAAVLTVAAVSAVSVVNAVHVIGQGDQKAQRENAGDAAANTLPKNPTDLAEGWSDVRGSLAGDSTALAAIRKRAADIFIKGVPYRGGNKSGEYTGEKVTAKDLRILIAGDVGNSRVVLLAGPKRYGAWKGHSDLLWLLGKAGAAPSDLIPQNCGEPVVCGAYLDRAGGAATNHYWSVDPATRVRTEHGGATGGYVVAAPPGSTVTVEAGERVDQGLGVWTIEVSAHPTVLATAAPVKDIPGLYQLPRLALGEPPKVYLLVSRKQGKLLWDADLL